MYQIVTHKNGKDINVGKPLVSRLEASKRIAELRKSSADYVPYGIKKVN